MDYSFIQRELKTLLTSIDSIHVNIDNTEVVEKLLSVVSSLNTINSSLITKNPIQKASTFKFSEILSAAIPALTPKLLFAPNPNRIGFCVYNNSTNSLYGGPTNSPANSRVFFQCASSAGPTALASFLGPTVWTGEIWVIRNSGIGSVTGYELEA